MKADGRMQKSGIPADGSIREAVVAMQIRSSFRSPRTSRSIGIHVSPASGVQVLVTSVFKRLIIRRLTTGRVIRLSTVRYMQIPKDHFLTLKQG